MLGELSNQTGIIQTKMNETVGVIQNTSTQMQAAVNETLTSFEARTYQAIEDLQTGANQTIAAGQEALAAAEKLKETAKKYSWSASVSPNPSLTGDTITLSLQGEPGLLPLVSLYSWDNKNIVKDKFFTEGTKGLYTYSFDADSRFAPGKAYTYIVTEQTTGGMVAGSGVVESMSITTVAGLAAAAPGAERAAKKALDAVKAVELILTTGDFANVGIALKNLKTSVDSIPEIITKEGPSAKLTQAVNDVAARIKTLAGDEGYNLATVFEKTLSESPAIKDIRAKTDEIGAASDIMAEIVEKKLGGADEPFIATSLSPGSVVFRLSVVNPSKAKRQKIEIKNYLPQEVRPKDVIDSAGLDIEYDQEKSLYYIYKTELELAPGEVKVFKVEVEDIWKVPEAELSSLKSQSEDIVKRLMNTQHQLRAQTVSENIYKELNEIQASQSDDTVSRSQHIGIYRQNLEILQLVKKDIAELEKILRPSSGPAAPEIIEKSKLKIGLPSKTTTWLIIIIIIVFLGMLAAVFFFVLQGQIRASQEVLKGAKESAFPEHKPQAPSGQNPPPEEKK